MTTSYKQRGDRITQTAGSGGVNSGDVIEIDSGNTGMIGVALTDASNGEEYEADVVGVHALTKATSSGSALTAGTIVYFDGTNITDTASANTRAGRVWADAADGDATVDVKLNAQ